MRARMVCEPRSVWVRVCARAEHKVVRTVMSVNSMPFPQAICVDNDQLN